ncbi:lysylphosphatidylglycerol synthase domain-containing protein [Paraburkholderia sp. MMS20-SJTR3]|uniref:Lysylphosphatidylglycerol synthase domain-containing protein n=1 Tax=Paraburkholderia sejongensis TaxID=2886946 RepID=A0ABS8JZX6_9BURK|nr:lysylphosphatidylglycerol synthase domain-containing protein [Paraburkholderia sp. MMS20-SJTR3]MCC8395248.1 lysylphosphatidylglycerol synthase domain-containing protein [Paraburkholderia sp. MMS20-SJTR3]
MKYLARIAALAGLAIAVWLVWHSDARAVLALLRTAGAGLVLAGVAHVLPMLANARNWQLLIRGPVRPNLFAMFRLVWIRESINGLLPVARVGGEVVTFRMMRKWGIRAAPAISSLVVDIQLTLISQMLFALAAIGYLIAHAGSSAWHLAARLGGGIAVLSVLLAGFLLVQRASPFARVSKLFNRMTSGKFRSLVGESVRIDRSISELWHQPGVIVRYLAIWQSLQCVATALELWLALHFLGNQASFLQAVVLESLIQALSSVAFFVPGALGIQEGGFLLIGTGLGLDPQTCLALAGARRFRDIIVFLPGLLAWQAAEWRDKWRDKRCDKRRGAEDLVADEDGA